jgi:hypothetical protein
MANFQQERGKIAVQLRPARQQEAQLVADITRLTTELTHVRARIASLEAEDQVYAGHAGNAVPGPGAGDLSNMTTREAILTVLGEAKPEPVRVRDLEKRMADRGKRVAGGVSVDLTSLKHAGKALNPAWGFWTVP